MRDLKNEEKIAIGAGLVVLSFIPILLGLAGVALIGFGAWDEFGPKK
jgi:hypothetical protein